MSRYSKGERIIETLVQCTNVVKRYGSKLALDHLNLEVTSGQIVGLLGPNGAGKTTLMKLIVSLLRDHRGDIRILGLKPGVETKKQVAYLPDREFLYPWLKVKEACSFFANAFEDFDRTKADRLISDLGLNPNDKVRALSKGMQERLGVALTFSRKARLFVLDEPLAAVDPSTRDKIMHMILENFDPNSAILVSTHLINEVESLFTHVAIIDDGKVILHGEVESLKYEKKQSIEEMFKAIVEGCVMYW